MVTGNSIEDVGKYDAIQVSSMREIFCLGNDRAQHVNKVMVCGGTLASDDT